MGVTHCKSQGPWSGRMFTCVEMKPEIIEQLTFLLWRRRMKALLRSSLVCLLSSGMLIAQSTDAAQNSATSKPKTSRTTARHRTAAAPAGPSTADQLKELRDMLTTQQQQIRQLQNQLAARDQQVQQAQQAATDANAKASDAAAKATEAQSTHSDTTAQVASLKDTVGPLKP